MEKENRGPPGELVLVHRVLCDSPMGHPVPYPGQYSFDFVFVPVQDGQP